MQLIGRCVVVSLLVGGTVWGADEGSSLSQATFRQYCFQCHSNAAAMGGVRLEQLAGTVPGGDNFQQWQKVAVALEQGRMPPKGMPQPGDSQRKQVAAWIRTALNAYAKQHDGDPGRVTVRRLTSGEYAYAIHDLTGIDPETGIDAASDSVGGEGFTNFGDVQFMQDASLEHYLAAAKKIADHAVIGSGAIEFFVDPGKTGYELSAAARIKSIYAEQGFRTVSGEGGISFGLEKYNKVFYVTWLYRHRAARGGSERDAEPDRGARGCESAIRAAYMDGDAHGDAGLSDVGYGGALAEAAGSGGRCEGGGGGGAGGVRGIAEGGDAVAIVAVRAR